ncbi:flavin reductase [uncultured Amnibacterium sp.]|uniref:flavin reductase n=1 Tax=uncultured Amnibacterium sp. TaxID=1631851 RepID=UPI0035CA2909
MTQPPTAVDPVGPAHPAEVAARSKSDWWRAVLGEYPTGVTLICARDDSGAPVGMVVGSFTAVSQDPPLVGFFPDQTSTTFPMIAASGSFTASVLGDSHEDLCRAFVRKAPDRFETGSFVEAESGNPRVKDAVAWFDVVIERRDTYGDHEFVVGLVEDFGVGDASAGLPLLFRRGGYGTFAVPTEEFDTEVLARHLRFADLAGDDVSELADTLGLEVLVSAVVHDSVVVLASARPGSRSEPASGPRRIGTAFPFAAPLAPAFVAWASPAQQSAWIEGSRHLIGRVDRPRLAALLASVRRRGYGVSPSRVLSERFTQLMDEDRPRRESFAQLWSDMAADGAIVDGVPTPETASAIQAPVFGPDGQVVVVLTVNGFSGLADPAAFGQKAELVLASAARMTKQINGVVPPPEL